MKNYVTNKVKSVTATGIDGYGIKTNSFFEVREVKENGRLLKISGLNESGKTNAIYRFDDAGRLIRQTDSANGVKSTTDYKYNAAGYLVSVINTPVDVENEFTQPEEHSWIYNATGLPEKMWKITNGKDSLLYEFSYDDKKNIAEEHVVRKGVKFDPLFYYYYDEKNRITDIARYNKTAQKILPDFMFEYDEQNRVIQKIATLAGAQIGYVYFRYGYNEKGLRNKEVLFDRYKNKTGTIEYEFVYGN